MHPSSDTETNPPPADGRVPADRRTGSLPIMTHHAASPGNPPMVRPAVQAGRIGPVLLPAALLIAGCTFDAPGSWDDDGPAGHDANVRVTRGLKEDGTPDDADEGTIVGASRRREGRPAVLGYEVGGIHPRNVRTVHVEMFDSREFRRQWEFRITEAVTKRILLDTPYRLAPAARADTVLTGELMFVSSAALGEQPDTGSVYAFQAGHYVRWKWKDMRTGRILFERLEASPELGWALNHPQFNESFNLGLDSAIDDTARRVVASMRKDF